MKKTRREIIVKTDLIARLTEKKLRTREIAEKGVRTILRLITREPIQGRDPKSSITTLRPMRKETSTTITTIL